MNRLKNPVIFAGCLILMMLTVLACSKPKEAKLVVSDHEFSIRNLEGSAYTIDASGKIKNTGEVDVKKVVVTAYCRSCFTGLAPGRWSASERERSDAEKCVINFIPAGGEADFHFTDVAVIYTTDGQKPKAMPEKMDVVIESFDTL